MNAQPANQVKIVAPAVTSKNTGMVLQRKCSCGQHTIGGATCESCSLNSGVAPWSRRLQRKLVIAEASDSYEREADLAADKVTAALSAPTVGRGHAPVFGVSPLSVQRQAVKPSAHRDDEEEKPMRENAEEHEVAQAKRFAPGSVRSTVVDGYVDSIRGGGQPLPNQTRTSMSALFGYDFSGVRVHSDSRAAESATSMNALAYTVGKNIVFGNGQYAPHTQEGRRLLAHELTHVVQQNGGASLQKKVVLKGSTMSAKERAAFLKARKWANTSKASAIMSDMAAAGDTFDFKDEDELEREIVKRIATVSYMQESQLTVKGDKRAFGYPFNPPAEIYGPRVNYDARDFWEPAVPDAYAERTDKKKNAEMLKMARGERCKVYGDQCGSYKWKLTASGKKDPYEAIIKLFVPQKPPRLRTLLHCDYLESLVNFRSFADSVGKTEFNKRINTFGADKIVLRWNAFNDLQAEVITKESGKTVKKPGLASLQKVVPSSEDDLVIGDHAIFYNHMAYDLINKKIGNAWRLENAVLVRKDDKGNDVFLGHGSGEKTKTQMKEKLRDEFNKVARRALELVKKTKSPNKKTASDGQDEMTKLFPKITEDGGKWKIKGKSGLCKSVDVDMELREIKRDEVVGLKDPCDLTKLEEVQRPIESK